MCGRYASQIAPEILARLFATTNPLVNFAPHYNVAPRQDAPIIRRNPATGARQMDLLNWGLLPHFSKDAKAAPRPINARAETLATSGLFRGAYAARRCLVPAGAFYEWETLPGGTPSKPCKQPWAIARADGAPLAMAGLWEGWRGAQGDVMRSFTIVTTAANAPMRRLHERMPVILEADAWPLWLGERPGDVAGLLRPAAEDRLRLWRVSAEVGNVRNDYPELLDEVTGGKNLLF